MVIPITLPAIGPHQPQPNAISRNPSASEPEERAICIDMYRHGRIAARAYSAASSNIACTASTIQHARMIARQLDSAGTADAAAASAPSVAITASADVSNVDLSARASSGAAAVT